MTGELRLEHFLPYRLSVLANTVSTSIAAAYSSQFGLSIPEWRVLAVLAAAPGISSAEVAQRTAMDKVAVSRAVSSLLRSRRLERSVAVDDRRRSQLRLSAQGRSVYRRVVPLARQYESRLLQTLSPVDQAALHRILDALQAHAGRLGPAPGAVPTAGS